MAERNTPVLVGSVPLAYVQTMNMSEGYRIERIAGSSFAQALAPTTKTIAIEAMLVGPKRLLLKKELEALALVSRVMVAAAAPALAAGGISVVSGMTISFDMQISDLRFSQSVQKRDAIDVSMTLTHVPRGAAAELLGEVADLKLAAGLAASSGPPPPSPLPRTPSVPFGGVG